MTRYQFWINLHALPATPLARGRQELNGQRFETLIVPAGTADTPLPVSFEDACAALNRLPQLLIEPDGSFVWSASHGEESWQVDGLLYDRAEKLFYVELKGACPSAQFDELLTIFGWPQAPMMFQLVREAVFLDEANFRRAAEVRRQD